MDFLKGNIKSLYFKYLAASFGSTLISSIYSIVDMAMVGQYHGPEGSAALAVVAPVWNIIYSFGLLMGIGGSVLFSTIRGTSAGRERESNEYFTASVIGSVLLAAVIWAGIAFFDRPLLLAFGAQEDTIGLAREYVAPVKFAVPLFLLNQMLSAYLRNDKNPALATVAVLAGGIFTVFGDYFFVFACDMGAYGAGLATAIGAAITFVVLMTHFLTKKNTLRLVRPKGLAQKLGKISVTGFSTFFIDVAMGILTILFNRQNQRPGGVWSDCEYQHLCPVLRLQRGTGVPAHLLHQLWRGKGKTDPGDIKIRFGNGRRLRRVLDSSRPGGAQSVYPRFHDPHGGGAGHSPRDFPVLRAVVPAAAF